MSNNKGTFGEYQVCPRCNGQGMVSKPPYIAGDILRWSGTSASHVCDVCNGAKIIQRPTIAMNEEPFKEETFTWTDELVEEFAKQYRFSSSRITAKMFKEGKGFPRKANDGLNSEGKIGIEVKGIKLRTANSGTHIEIGIVVSDNVPESKLPIIKEAIERVLNKTNEPDEKTYTQSEVLKMQEDAWDAARKLDIDRMGLKWPPPKKYETFTDYLQSLNQSTKQP